MQFGRLDWEFESGERAIHVDSAALKDGKADRLNRRLYRAVDVDLGDEELFKDFSPAFRQSDITDGLNTYLRMIEFAVGLHTVTFQTPKQLQRLLRRLSRQRTESTTPSRQFRSNFAIALMTWCMLLRFTIRLQQAVIRLYAISRTVF